MIISNTCNDEGKECKKITINPLPCRLAVVYEWVWSASVEDVIYII